MQLSAMDDAASEIARLRAALAASEARVASAEADLAQVRAVVTTSEAMIRHLKLEIAKMRREQYGQSSERRARPIDQMELQLEELEADATEDEIAAERVAAKITNISAFERRRPARNSKSISWAFWSRMASMSFPSMFMPASHTQPNVCNFCNHRAWIVLE